MTVEELLNRTDMVLRFRQNSAPNPVIGAGYLRIPVTELRLPDTKVNGLLGINPPRISVALNCIPDHPECSKRPLLGTAIAAPGDFHLRSLWGRA